jgi:hypothetical protein
MGILSSLLGIGQSAPTPVAPQTIQTTELSKEVAPFMKDLLEKGQALYKTRTEEGFQPYTGQTLAELSPEQIQARAGLTGLVGSQAPQFAKAQELTEGVAQQMTPELAQQYMSPYQQAVTDLDKAEAQKTFERDVLPKVRQAQIGAGAFGGTRGTMLEAQALADQQKLVGDIQTRGSQSAYQDAIRSFEAQKQREGSTGQALANLAPAAFKAQTGELGLLEQIGKEDQMRSQSALDESYKQYLQERVFPEQTLGQYQSVIAGFPSASTTRTTTTAPQPQQSGLGSLLGGALNAANIYGTFGGFTDGGFGSAYMKRAEGGPVISKAFGGRIGEGGFLGMTADGQNLWQKTQEGITNRSIHGGVLEGEGASTATLNAIAKQTPTVSNLSPSNFNIEEGMADQYGNTVGDFSGSKDYYDLNFAARDAGQDTFMYGDKLMQVDPGYLQGGGRNPFISNRFPAGLQQEVIDRPDLFRNASNVNTITKIQGDPTDPGFYSEPSYLPTAGFNQDVSRQYDSYYDANQAAKEAGSPTFMYGSKLAKTDPGLLPNYQGGPKPFISNAVPEKYISAGLKFPPGWNNMSAQQLARAQIGNYRLNAGTYGANPKGNVGTYGANKHGGPVIKREGGGLMSLPTMYRAVGTEGAGPFTLPNANTGLIGGLTLEQIGALPVDQQRQFLTKNIYDLAAEERKRSATDKTRIEAELAKEEAMLDTETQARKSSAIGNMLGSFARGMKKGAGQGFGGELLSGLEEGAEASTEMSEKDRTVLKTAEEKLAKSKKDAAALWDKGNKDKALELLNIANQNYTLELKRLEVGYNKLAARNDAIIQLKKLFDASLMDEYNAMSKNFISMGVFDNMSQIEESITTGSALDTKNPDSTVIINAKKKTKEKKPFQPFTPVG